MAELIWDKALLTLEDILAEVRNGSGKTVGPANPKAKTETGYEYRAVPAKVWAKVADLDPELADLAWAVASEAPRISAYPQYGYAIAEMVCNAGIELVTKDRRPEVDGHYGRQSGRWCASFEQPTERHLRCAMYALLSRGKRPNLIARGAVQWLDCRTQIAMNKRRPQTNPPPETVLKSRYNVGRKWVGPIPDIDPFRLMMFGRDGVSYKEAADALADGRQRWGIR